ncbi:MAG: copper resistance protein B [Desulfobacteraceae bacterium]|nr:copper resistance protein B [Desulfobacteraceae bacterium]
MLTSKRCLFFMIIAVVWITSPCSARDMTQIPVTTDRPDHQESASEHRGEGDLHGVETPPLPEGMSLDEVLDYAAGPPPKDFPATVPDRLYVFTLFEKLEYRIADDDTPDHVGWEAQGWVGGDYHKFWWKHEGEAVFDGPDTGETETDLLYSRLVTPFWNFQMGVQYANEWEPDDYGDRWSGVIAFQGLAPYKFELDNALYVSEDGDVTFTCEAEYDVRITQRLVLQPLAELHFAAQDISERNLGAGITDVNLDLRLRYEIKREFAPYIGIRYRFLVGETADIAEAAGAETSQLYFMAGCRFAF